MVCLTLFCRQAGWAESGKLSEYEVKASYLYNFAKYVDWPTAALPGEASPLTMCIIGNSHLNEDIESLSGKTIKNRRLAVHYLGKHDDPGVCNILFINAAEKASVTQILASLAARSILTVSDGKGFAAAGGIIEFILLDDKIRFKINNRAAQHVNLRISSHLLRLATAVIE
jgi:hypothetical protein